MLTAAEHYATGLLAPEGIARHGDWLAVTDSTSHQLVVVDVTRPAQVARLGMRGTAPASEGFLFPSGVAFTAAGRLYVADGRNRHLDHYRLAAGTWSWHSSMDPFGALAVPAGVLLDAAAEGAGTLLVLDDRRRVLAVNIAANTATVRLADPRWRRPVAIASAAGSLWVADADAHVVYRYDASGALLATIGGYGSATGGMRAPMGVAVDTAAARLYVSEGVGGMVGAWDFAGNPLGRVALPLDAAHSLRRCAVDATGRLVVADAGAGRVQALDTAALAVPSARRRTLGFGAVAVGYTTVLPLVIDNPGATPLQLLTAEVRGAAFATDASSPALPVTVAPGSSATLVLRFTPARHGLAAGEVLLATDSLRAPMIVATLTGEGAGAEPVAVGLVLDTSGSMARPSGVMTKMQRLHQAASLVTDLLAVPGSNEISVTRFSTQATVPLPRTILGAANAPAARAVITALAPSGNTSIGAGIQSSLADLAPTLLTRQAMIVMTDGLENTAPLIAAVAVPPATRVYTVGLGLPQHVDAARLQALASRNGGYFQVTDGDDLLLSKFFVQVFGDIVGDDVAFDPPILLRTGRPYEVAVDVTSTDHALTGVLAWENATALLDLELETPQGRIIPLTRAGWAVQRDRYLALRVDVRRHGGAGTWIVRAHARTAAKAGERAILTVLARSDDAVTWSVQGEGPREGDKVQKIVVEPTTEGPGFPRLGRPPAAPRGVRVGERLRVVVHPTVAAQGTRIRGGELTVVPPRESLARLRAKHLRTNFDRVKLPDARVPKPAEARQVTFRPAKDRGSASAIIPLDGPDGIYQVRLVVHAVNRLGERFRRERAMSILAEP